jgi:hypothetical protein
MRAHVCTCVCICASMCACVRTCGTHRPLSCTLMVTLACMCACVCIYFWNAGLPPMSKPHAHQHLLDGAPPSALLAAELQKSYITYTHKLTHTSPQSTPTHCHPPACPPRCWLPHGITHPPTHTHTNNTHMHTHTHSHTRTYTHTHANTDAKWEQACSESEGHKDEGGWKRMYKGFGAGKLWERETKVIHKMCYRLQSGLHSWLFVYSRKFAA